MDKYVAAIETKRRVVTVLTGFEACVALRRQGKELAAFRRVDSSGRLRFPAQIQRFHRLNVWSLIRYSFCLSPLQN